MFNSIYFKYKCDNTYGNSVIKINSRDKNNTFEKIKKKLRKDNLTNCDFKLYTFKKSYIVKKNRHIFSSI